MSFKPIKLKRAPRAYILNCDLHHDEVGNVKRQWFKGDRVRVNYYKSTGLVEALVDNRVVGTWTNLTVGMWSDILYTLETEFKDKINK